MRVTIFTWIFQDNVFVTCFEFWAAYFDYKVLRSLVYLKNHLNSGENPNYAVNSRNSSKWRKRRTTATKRLREEQRATVAQNLSRSLCAIPGLFECSSKYRTLLVNINKAGIHGEGGWNVFVPVRSYVNAGHWSCAGVPPLSLTAATHLTDIEGLLYQLNGTRKLENTFSLVPSLYLLVTNSLSWWSWWDWVASKEIIVFNVSSFFPANISTKEAIVR